MPNAIDAHIGRRLRERREQLKMTPSDLAVAVGLAGHELAAIEQGAQRLQPSQMMLVNKALKLETADLFRGLSVTDYPKSD
jgi:transcriptional regulator with XRE-family HTH domain